MKPTLLIIDDDEAIRTQMKWAVSADYDVIMAADRQAALDQFQAGKPVVTLLDLGLPPAPHDSREGMAALAGIMNLDRSAKVIVVSGQSDRENAVRAVGAGAYDFLCKPVNTDELKLLIQRCIFVSGLEHDYRELNQADDPGAFEGILGSSSCMQDVFQTVRKVARSTAPVLILGESGTGKEMVARAIHRQSTVRDKPFIAINCSAIPESLLESELFGYEKGAFTGANTQRIGLIESAAGGTVFLDEIGDLPAAVQVKLLRFLQEKRIQRVGGRVELEMDTRVVAATNVNLEQAIKAGSFREDLFFRLAVVVCKLPPLRDRGEDAALLAADFLARFAAQNGRPGLSFEPQALRAITLYPWPGNVRELQNRVHRAVIMAEGKRVSAGDMELAAFTEGTPGRSLKDAREDLEREMIERALSKHGGKITAAASELGVSRPTFYELMSKLGISRS